MATLEFQVLNCLQNSNRKEKIGQYKDSYKKKDKITSNYYSSKVSRLDFKRRIKNWLRPILGGKEQW